MDESLPDHERLILSLENDGCGVADELVPVLYQELRDRAQRFLQAERRDHTLQPTALVHEAYLRLARNDELRCASREEFLAWASRIMRQVLINHARDRKREKRGGGAGRVALDDILLSFEEKTSEFESLDEALNELERFDASMSRVVELRFFGGLTAPEIGNVLGKSRATIERQWRFARAWLHSKLRGELSEPK